MTLLRQAAELEHTLCLQYLYAAFTLKQGGDTGLSSSQAAVNVQWYQQMTHVAIQEMYHLLLASNLLTALGEAPNLWRPNFPFPGNRYSDIGLVSTLTPFGYPTITRFLCWEQPDAEGWWTQTCEVASWSTTVQVPAGGHVEVPLMADRPGCFKLRYMPADMPGDPQDNPAPNWSVEFFSTFRVLPYDDYSSVPDADITFEFVYKEVLNYFTILFPIMSTIIPWGPDNTPRDPDRVAQFAALIRQAIDESRIGTALEMPITRDLSAGKRALLRRWCDLQLQDGG